MILGIVNPTPPFPPFPTAPPQLTVELNGQPLGQFPFPIYFSAPDLQAAAKALEAASAAAAAAGSGAAAVNGPVPTAPGPVSAAQLSAGAVGFGVAQPIPGAAPPTLVRGQVVLCTGNVRRLEEWL